MIHRRSQVREPALKRVLVTGGAGFIGSHIVDAVVENRCDVIVLDNLSTGSLANLDHVAGKIAFCRGDIREFETVMEAARGCDSIFHQAAMVSVPQTVASPLDSAIINEIGTLNVLEAARKTGVPRVILASSCAVYGDDPHLPKHELLVPRPQSPYAVQKLTGEYYARLYNDLYGVQTISLRYFNVFGPRQDPSSPYSGVISIFMTRLFSDKSPVVYGDGNQYRDFIFVKDVVRANLLAASSNRTRGGVYNIGTGRCVSINDLWKMICRISGRHIEPVHRPPRAGDIRQSVASIDLAKSAFGFQPGYSFDNGLELTFDWYCAKEMGSLSKDRKT